MLMRSRLSWGVRQQPEIAVNESDEALYVVAVPVVILLSYIVTAMAFPVADWAEQWHPSYWYVVAINFGAPALSGGATGLYWSRIARSRGRREIGFRAHLRRNRVMYGMILCFGYIVAINMGNTDFGLWSQLIEWPLTAMLAFVSADLAIMMVDRTGHRPAA